ncbi:MAG TPA: hypothetical protein VME43_16530 [Bryobacteraceae bacterium]|nr:hypothetical protein [Bryobacteraceae bacterium]
MSKKPFPQNELRAALRGALPENDQISGNLRAPQFTYVPPSHAKALNPDSTIVEGMRGAGKSHWWAALNLPQHRRYLAAAFPEARIEGDFTTSQGFGLGLSPELAPSKDILASLMKKYKPRNIWRGVVAVHASLPIPFPQGSAKWETRVLWVQENPEEYETLIYKAGNERSIRSSKHLILFDALDRLADDWPGLRPLARALFQLALDMLANRGLRLKLFVRPDMLEDKEILAFPDSSKLLARKVALTWQRADLYALLFQCLANEDEHGLDFRKHCQTVFNVPWEKKKAEQAWILPDGLRNDEELQKEVFHALAGPAMATGQHGHKRGFPYTWLPNHLVDSRDQVSPRSFFAALRSALAVDPPPDWPYALHYKGIQKGVQEASTIRVKEITQEDYPWVEPLMEPLRNKIVVPCTVDDIVGLWWSANTIERIKGATAQTHEVKLLPPHFEEGPPGVLRDLKELGVLNYLWDGRVQMPDIYRIAFGLGRKGGVKPLK